MLLAGFVPSPPPLRYQLAQRNNFCGSRPHAVNYFESDFQIGQEGQFLRRDKLSHVAGKRNSRTRRWWKVVGLFCRGVFKLHFPIDLVHAEKDLFTRSVYLS